MTTPATRERIERLNGEINTFLAMESAFGNDHINRERVKELVIDCQQAIRALTALCEEMEREKEDERIELVMHEVFMESLLDDLKAPKHPDNDPSRPKFGPYGRLRAYAESIGVKASMWEPLPQPPAT